MKTEEKEELQKLREQRKKQITRQNAYIAEKYDRISIAVPKGQKQAITDQSKKKGFKGISDYLIALIKADSTEN